MTNQKESELKYCQYCRKSSESKEKQALSIPDQIAECNKAATLNQLNVVMKLSESKSSYKPHIRPEFDKMIDVSMGMKPLWENALGKDWEKKMTREKLRLLFEKL